VAGSGLRSFALAVLFLFGLTCVRPGRLEAAPVTKAATGTDLTLSSSWSGGVLPGVLDVALFDATLTGGTSFLLSGSLSLAGVQLTNPGGPVSLATETYTLSLGAEGLDLASARQDLTLTGLLNLSAAQTWSVSQGRTLNVLSSVGGGTSAGLWKSGRGTAVLSGSNTYTGQTAVTGGVLLVTNGSALGTGASPVLVGGDSLIGGGALILAGPGGTGFTLAQNLTLSGYGSSSTPAAQGSGMVLAQAALLSVGNNTLTGSVTTSSASVTRIHSAAGQLTLAGQLNLGA
ncbi:MAG: hypothetical protein JHC85_14570, partial [Chthoniobacterales bacterium]|nr:hypothetical protein [Chthoniobacterales bacterium]